MEKLSDMPNIGGELEKKLIEVGICTPAHLMAEGSCNAFIRLYTVDNTSCINTLYALEGAVQGIRWHTLDKARKHELMQFMHAVSRGERG